MDWNTSGLKLFGGEPTRSWQRCIKWGSFLALIAMPVSSLLPRTQWWISYPYFVAQIVLEILRGGSDPKTSPRVADRSTSDVATSKKERCNVDFSVDSLRVTARILPSVTGGQRRTSEDKAMCTCDSLAILRRLGSDNEIGNVHHGEDKAKSSLLDQRSEGRNACHGEETKFHPENSRRSFSEGTHLDRRFRQPKQRIRNVDAPQDVPRAGRQSQGGDAQRFLTRHLSAGNLRKAQEEALDQSHGIEHALRL